MFSGDYLKDCEILLEHIKDINYATPTSRMKQFNIPKKIGGSVLYGYTWRSYISKKKDREYCDEMKRYKTTLHSERPELWNIFKQFRDKHFPGFKFSGVQLNKNYRILPHKDNANVGQSYLVVLGDYETGGRTIVETESTLKFYDGRKKPITFDGSKYLHWVEQWQGGDRFSCVFFNDLK